MDFSQIHPAAITGNFAFPTVWLTGLLKSNSANRHFRWVTFWSRTSLLRDRRRWADFSTTSTRYKYEGFPMFRFYGFTELFKKVIHRIATSDESHSVGVFQPDPRYNYDAFPLSQFTDMRNFLKSNSPNRQIRGSTFWSKTSISRERRRWADLSHISARCNYERIALFQFYGHTWLFKT